MRTPRPLWMASPPPSALEERRCNRSSDPNAVHVTLVSVGLGTLVYTKPLQRYNKKSVRQLFNRTLLWGAKELSRDPIFAQQLRASIAHSRSNVSSRRPYCAAFKPLVLWRALQQACEGDYVLWADSSAHFPKQALEWIEGSRRLHIHGLVQSLAARGIESVYGQVHCPFDCGGHEASIGPRGDERRYGVKRANPPPMVSPITAGEYSELGYHWNARTAPHVMNTYILLRNRVVNRLLMWDWLQMAIAKPTAFCDSPPQDQSAWTILVHNRSLPLVSMCAHRARVRENCYHDLKNINEFLAHLRNGTFSVQY